MDYLKKNTYFLLRHGEATYNVSRTIASAASEASDNPSVLTDIGKEQAEAAAEKLAGESIDFIYSSPYKRTIETATIVARRLGLDIETDDRLYEVDVGTWSGKTIDEYKRDFHGKDRLRYSVEGGESLMDVRTRTEEFLDDMNKRYENKKILVVSHGDVLWMMQSVFLEVEGEEILKTPYIETGEVRKFGG